MSGANSESSSGSLFRREVLDRAAGATQGQIVLVRPVTYSFLTGIFIAITATIVIFVCTFGYAQKVEVAGVLRPTAGMLKVVAAQGGFLKSALVKEGQKISAGQTLFVVNSRRESQLGDTDQAVVALLQRRRASLVEDRDRAGKQLFDRIASLKRRRQDLEAEILRLDEQADLLAQRVKLVEQSVRRLEDLSSTGFVSPVQVQEKQGDLIDQKQRRADVARARSASLRELEANTAEQRDLATQQMREQELATRSIAQLDQEVLEAAGRQEQIIRAPNAGVISGLLVGEGNSVSAGQVLANIIPDGATLEAEMFAPSKAVGFLRPGERVQIRYQSFAFQKFGQGSGVVTEVSSAPLRPDEMASSSPAFSPSSTESLYRVRVRLDKQTITANGREHALKVGTQVDASILLSERKLYEWIIDPLYTISGLL